MVGPSMKRGVAKKVSLYVGGLGSGSLKSRDIESRRTFSNGVVVVVSNISMHMQPFTAYTYI